MRGISDEVEKSRRLSIFFLRVNCDYVQIVIPGISTAFIFTYFLKIEKSGNHHVNLVEIPQSQFLIQHIQRLETTKPLKNHVKAAHSPADSSKHIAGGVNESILKI